MRKRLTTAEFIKKARIVHGDRYDYSKVKYVNANSKVIITCSKHGEFEQAVKHHASGIGCPDCAIEASRINDIFIPPENESAKELDW